MKRAALLLVLAACHRTEPSAVVDAGAGTSSATVANSSSPSPPDAAAGDACGAEASLKSGKSVGHTSLVFKIELADGRKLAWKPNAMKVRNRWRGEIAAYRLAQFLGIGANVPPACPRRFPVETALHVLPVHGLDDALPRGATYEGAVIPWIDGLQFWAIEKDPLRTDVRGWLANGPPAGKEDLARQASDLVVFDAITGNWDRYSGGNVGIDKSGATVLFIDNDAAFMEGPPRDRLEENRSLLAQTNHFSRSLVAKVRGVDASALRTAFGATSAEDSGPLIAPARIDEAVARTKAALAVIDEKIATRGDAAVLSLP